jgi:hypothetical protein
LYRKTDTNGSHDDALIRDRRNLMMRQVVLLLGIGCLTALCAAGMWLASRPPIPLSFPPDATDLQMATDGGWGWTFRYRTPGASDSWYSTIVHQLETDGWIETGERYVGGPVPNPATYTRMASFGLLVVWERVEVDSDMHGVHLRMYCWIAIRPFKLLLPPTSDLPSMSGLCKHMQGGASLCDAQNSGDHMPRRRRFPSLVNLAGGVRAPTIGMGSPIWSGCVHFSNNKLLIGLTMPRLCQCLRREVILWRSNALHEEQGLLW